MVPNSRAVVRARYYGCGARALRPAVAAERAGHSGRADAAELAGQLFGHAIMGVACARSGRLSLLNARDTQAGLTLLDSLGSCLGTLL